MSQTVLITGGTGLIGKSLSALLLKKGYKVIILTRNMVRSSGNELEFAIWNVEKQEIDGRAIQKADYIIHLAGAGVMDKNWDEKYKKEIVESRTHSSALLCKGLNENKNMVKAVISSSAIGWYGKDATPLISIKGFTELDPPDAGFLGETCRLWEQSIEPIEKINIRLVKLRTGIVLSNSGGAYPQFKKSLQFGIASILGSGKQVVSWIHVDDLCAMFLYALENENVQGCYNAVAPIPVSNKTLIIKTAQHLKGTFFVPVHVPAFVLNFFMGKRSIEILKSTTVDGTKIQEAGFNFLYPGIDVALKELSMH